MVSAHALPDTAALELPSASAEALTAARCADTLGTPVCEQVCRLVEAADVGRFHGLEPLMDAGLPHCAPSSQVRSISIASETSVPLVSVAGLIDASAGLTFLEVTIDHMKGNRTAYVSVA